MKTLSLVALMAATLSVGATGNAAADELQPMEAQHVSLGAVSGIVYFTAQGGSDVLVATLGAGGTELPVRFETSLLVGQSVVLSVPREAGKAAVTVRFERHGDRVLVIQDPAS